MKKRIVSIILAVILVIGVLPIAAVPAFAEGGIPTALQNTSWKGTAAPSAEAEPTPFLLQIGTDSARFTYNNETVTLPFFAYFEGEDPEALTGGENLAFQKVTDEGTFSLAVNLENGAVLGFIGQFITNFFASKTVTKCTTLRDILGTVGGTYSAQGTGAAVQGGNVTFDVSFALDSSNIANEIRFLFGGLMIYGQKEQYDAESKKYWQTDMALAEATYGEPISDNTKTIEYILNAPVILTERETEIKYDGGMFMDEFSTIVPAGSYYCEELGTYFFTTEEGLKKINFSGFELTREEEEPETLTLRDIIGKVGGTYSGINSSGTSVTITINSNELSYVTIYSYGYAERAIVGNTGTKFWDTETFVNGQPVFDDDNYEEDKNNTIETILNLEVEILTEGVTVEDIMFIPAGSYVVGEQMVFYNEQNGVTQNWLYGGAVLNRIGGTEHEHTFAAEYSSNEAVHWLAATCKHTELTKNLGEHTFGTDGKCTVCGYEKQTDALTEAKNTAKAEMEEAVKNASKNIQDYAVTAKEKIDGCANITAVIQTLVKELDTINGMKTEEAVAAATAALNGALAKAKTVAAKKIGEDALVMLANAKTPEEAKAIETEAIKLMSEKDESIQNTCSLTLSGNIGTNVYLDLDAYAAENLQVKITFNTSNTAYKPNYTAKTFTKAELDNGEGRYVYTVWQAPAQIAEDITVEIYDGDTLLDTVNVNGKTYADAVMKGDYNPKLKALAQAMVVYADEAAKYFNYAAVSSQPDYKVITAEDGDIYNTTLTGIDMSGVESFSFSGGSVRGITFMSLDESALRVYYNTDCKITEASLTEPTGASWKVTVNSEKNYVEVSGIEGANLGDVFTVTTNVGTFTASALSYAKAAYATNTNFCGALYNYAQAAAAYFPKEA